MTGRRSVGVLAVACAVLMAWGCDEPEPEPGEWEPLVAFDTIAVAVISGSDTIRITAELADTDERRSYGLMERPDLAEDHGMIFVYPETLRPTGQFWMYRTRVPLDIAFLDEAGEIVAILAMDPCQNPNPEFCQPYSPGIPYRGALEVSQGFFERHGVEVGDRVIPPPGELPAVH